MRKVYISIGIAAFALLLLASAFAFSFTLQNLRVNAFSFAQPAAAAVIAAPMTSAEEAEISSPSLGSVRLEPVTVRERLCQKNKGQVRTTDF
ncbi:MAG: hypothetical protein EYC68_15090 [Chloroflexota bacterium]|nr:MAG: hypothetical protein EYC68_15090 [Chloroflexota bacterium]